VSIDDVKVSLVGGGQPDTVRLWIKAKQSYAAKRGSLRAAQTALDSNNRPYMLVGDTYPRTTYYDIAFMAGTWVKATRGMGNTTSSVVARADWLRSMPGELTGALNMLASYDDYSYLATYLEKVSALRNAIYPNDEAFWGSGKILAIAQSAASGVPAPFELAVESVKEAVQDRVGDIVDNLPCIRLDCLFPSWLVWGTVGLSGLWLYSKLRKGA
jgi:hypothetical protein